MPEAGKPEGVEAIASREAGTKLLVEVLPILRLPHSRELPKRMRSASTTQTTGVQRLPLLPAISLIIPTTVPTRICTGFIFPGVIRGRRTQKMNNPAVRT